MLYSDYLEQLDHFNRRQAENAETAKKAKKDAEERKQRLEDLRNRPPQGPQPKKHMSTVKKRKAAEAAARAKMIEGFKEKDHDVITDNLDEYTYWVQQAVHDEYHNQMQQLTEYYNQKYRTFEKKCWEMHDKQLNEWTAIKELEYELKLADELLKDIKK